MQPAAHIDLQMGKRKQRAVMVVGGMSACIHIDTHKNTYIEMDAPSHVELSFIH